MQTKMPMTAVQAGQILAAGPGMSTKQVLDGPEKVSMISATLNVNVEVVTNLTHRIRSLTEQMRIASNQVYGEMPAEAETTSPDPANGGAGQLQAQLQEMDLWITRMECEANRLCGSA